MRESPSLLAFPSILAVHTIGLGLMAGLNAVLDFCLLGWVREVPSRAFRVYVPLMWVGLWLNVVSGMALLVAYPTKALTNPVFYAKLSLIAIALWLFRRVVAGIAAPRDASAAMRWMAIASLICWTGAIVTGRLLAYTCTRLTVDSMCD